MRPSLRDRVLGPSCCAHRTNCTLDCSHRRYYAARRRRAGRTRSPVDLHAVHAPGFDA